MTDQLLSLELIRRRPRAARKADVLLAQLRLHEVARKLAAGAPEIDLEGQRILTRSAVEHPLQRRIRHEAAVPILLAVDLGRWKPGRQRAAGHHMRRADLMRGVVEIDEVAGADVHSADAETHRAFIDQVEVHQALERGFEGRDVVETDGLGGCQADGGKAGACAA